MYVYECVLKWCKQWCNALSVRLRQVLRRKNLLCVAYYNIKRYRFFLESRTVLELKSVKPIIHSQIRSTVLWGFSKIGLFCPNRPYEYFGPEPVRSEVWKKITHKRVMKISRFDQSLPWSGDRWRYQTFIVARFNILTKHDLSGVFQIRTNVRVRFWLKRNMCKYPRS